MLVSPTEHKLADMGKASSVPEKYGADFLFISAGGLVGVQRKELRDFVSSTNDGRLAKELGQMNQLSLGILVLEGEARWTREDQMVGVRVKFTRPMFYGLVFATMQSGVWVLQTSGIQGTRELLPLLEKWLSKRRHSGIASRPNPAGEWGRVGSRDWGSHILQSFQGIGAETAGRIYDHFGGVPLAWSVSRKELEEVKGVGKGRSETLYRALQHGEGS